MIKAVAYARVSTMAQRDEVSLDTQIEAIAEYAAKNGFEIIRDYKEVFSGAELFERPLLSEARESIRQGAAKALIVFDVDRLSRQLGHLAILMDECTRYNAKLLFVQSEFNDSIEGKILFSIQGIFAEAERLKIIERTSRGRQAKAKRGTLSFKRKLFGYELTDEGKRVFHKTESVIVKEMFADYLSGKSLRDIAVSLNARGIKTPSGKLTWWANSVRAILENPAYMGRTVVNRQKKIKKYRGGNKYVTTVSTKAVDQIELPAGLTPALVTKEDFGKAQKQFQANKKAKHNLIKHDFLLRGLVTCANCGRTCSPVVNRGSRAYVCTSHQNPTIACRTKRLNAEAGEDAVWSAVLTYIKNPKKLESVIKRASKSGENDFGAEKKRIVKMIEKAESEISNLIERGAEVSRDVWEIIKEKISIKETENGKLKEVLVELENKIQSVPQVDLKSINAFILTIRPILNELTFKEKRQALEICQISADWNGRDLHIYIGEKHYDGKGNFNGFYDHNVFVPRASLWRGQLVCA